MRSQADLAAAFALIEASVDEYSERAAAPEPAHVVDLVPDRPHSTPGRPNSRRRLLPFLSGAALAASAAALLVALTGLGSSGSQPTRPAAAGLPALGSDGRTLPFTLSPAAGLQVVGVTSTATGHTAELASRDVHLNVWFGEPDQDLRISPGLEPVTIGQQRGYYDDGSSPALTQGSDAAPSAASLETPGSFAEQAVVWEYAPAAFAVVTGYDPDSPPSRADLLQAASGIRITDAAPLDLSFRLARGPALGALTEITATSRTTDAAQAPYTFTSGATLCKVSYTLPASGNGIGVTVYSSAPGDQSSNRGSGDDVVVDGHPARWDIRFHQLTVDLGHDVYVQIVEENFTGGYTLNLPDYEQIFGLVSVVPDVADPSTWIAAEGALP